MIRKRAICFVLWAIYQVAVFTITGERADGAGR